MRVVELFCGIGGCAAAIGDRAHIVAAVDQNRHALAVYARNFATSPGAAASGSTGSGCDTPEVPALPGEAPRGVHGRPNSRAGSVSELLPRAVESFDPEELASFDADLWWMSPPCPPYTTRGFRRDLDDRRARSFVALMECVAAVRPRFVALENVPGFSGSRAHRLLRETLAAAGYDVRETLLCPTELGIPNRRRRFYLLAAREPLFVWPARSGRPRCLAEFLDENADEDLWVDSPLAARYAGALNVVFADDPQACAACFTSAYGRSPVRSGSYLATAHGLRRFSPGEILRFLGFPPRFQFPAGVTRDLGWRLAGNSLSVFAVRWVLSAVPGLSRTRGSA